MRAFHLILSVATLLVPLSAERLLAQQARSSGPEDNGLANRPSQSPARSPSTFLRTQSSNVRVGFGRAPAQVATAQSPTPPNRASVAVTQTDRRSFRNRLHLQIRTPLGWVRVRLAS